MSDVLASLKLFAQPFQHLSGKPHVFSFGCLCQTSQPLFVSQRCSKQGLDALFPQPLKKYYIRLWYWAYFSSRLLFNFLQLDLLHAPLVGVLISHTGCIWNFCKIIAYDERISLLHSTLALLSPPCQMTEAPPQEDWSYLWFPQSGFVDGSKALSSLMSVWYVFLCEWEF